MRGYLTPDSIPPGMTCRVLFIPDDRDWVAQVYGAIEVLTFPSAWTQFGALTPEETAAVYEQMYFKLLDNVRGCRMVGEVMLWAGADVPDDPNLLLCDGTHYDSDDYPALWGIIGLTYGGSGSSDFAVPDLRGRIAIGSDTGYAVGSSGGAATVTLTTAQIPAHNHTNSPHSHSEITAVASLAEAPVIPIPSAVPGVGITGANSISIDNTGGDEEHENMQPYLTMNYYIQAR